MESLWMFVLILSPTSIYKHSLHPLILWIKYKYKWCFLILRPLVILSHGPLKIFAFILNYKLYVEHPLLCPPQVRFSCITRLKYLLISDLWTLIGRKWDRGVSLFHWIWLGFFKDDAWYFEFFWEHCLKVVNVFISLLLFFYLCFSVYNLIVVELWYLTHRKRFEISLNLRTFSGFMSKFRINIISLSFRKI